MLIYCYRGWVAGTGEKDGGWGRWNAGRGEENRRRRENEGGGGLFLSFFLRTASSKSSRSAQREFLFFFLKTFGRKIKASSGNNASFFYFRIKQIFFVQSDVYAFIPCQGAPLCMLVEQSICFLVYHILPA